MGGKVGGAGDDLPVRRWKAASDVDRRYWEAAELAPCPEYEALELFEGDGEARGVLDLASEMKVESSEPHPARREDLPEKGKRAVFVCRV